MRIAIVGAGWVGCHLAKHLMDKNNIDIYECNEIFHGSSYHNQNRLHLGFHYPRNKRTRNLCKTTFNRFLLEYGELVNDVNNNIYSISSNSLIDFETYKDILTYDGIDFKETNIKLNNIEGSIISNEKYIDFSKAKLYFTKLIGDKVKIKKIFDIGELSNNYDLVINCTNNIIKTYESSYYELTVSLLYEKINNELSFDALTIVDGDFFSIYPYQDNLYTITDVKYTPVYSDPKLDNILNKNIDIELIRQLIESKITKIYTNFKNDFKYNSYFTSIKTKTYNNCADRYPIIIQNNNTISCFTGKIQGIYIIEDMIKRIINEK